MVLRLFVIFLINIHLFLYNDYCDKEEDAKDILKNERNFFCHRQDSINYRIAMTLLFFIPILSLLITVVFDLTFLLYVVLGFFMCFIYSNQKVRIKSKPVLDMVLHGIWPVYLLLPFVLDAERLSSKIRSFIIMIVFWNSVITQMAGQIRDYLIDKKNKIRNTIQLFTQNKAKKILKSNFILMNLFLIIVLFLFGQFFSGGLIIFLTILTLKYQLTIKTFLRYRLIMVTIILFNYLIF
ncbi:UbiA family prenyltransferase [Candidatus Woesearchaeota archaeon]|nr:UbiA family prenyltransferase [Candidatus Woesearchaeota archaeon]